jgi:replicative DNA helicase
VTAQFDFNVDFQLQVLALMKQDFEFLIFAQDTINPEYFSNRKLIWFFTTMRNHYLDYQSIMTNTALQNEMIQGVKRNVIKDKEIETYKKYYLAIIGIVNRTEYIPDEVVAFCKQQAIKKVVFDMPALLLEREFPTIESNMADAFAVGSNLGDVGSQFFINFADRIKNREQKYDVEIIPTGITELDIFLNGGIKPKQLGIWMGPTSRGKSIALLHCGKRAVIMGKNVLYYTFELSEEEVAERYDSSFSTIPVGELFNKEHELSRRMTDLGRRWGNSLIIKEYPAGNATLSTLKSHYNQCVHIGFEPDLILVDYLDLMRPLKHRKQKREELSDITTDLRGWATDLEVPLWSATQAQRQAISMKTHTEEQVGEDIGKANIADIVITLNQTPDEVANNVMRLFLAKNRNGKKYVEIPVEYDFNRMCFYKPV